MSKRLTGLNPLAYIGVEPSEPSNMYMSPESPTPTDVRNVNIGDFWVNTTTLTLYVLVSQQGGVATWIPLSAGGGATTNFITDSGTATEFGGAINILGDGVNTNTSASGNTVNVNLDPNLTVSHLKLTGIGIEGVVQTDASGNLFANNGTAGQVLIGGGVAPAWHALTAGSNINIVNGANAITISASGAGGGGATTFITDINSPASETGGDITFAGGHNITTDGSTPNTVTLNLTGTTNHAVQVGNSTGSLTSLALGTDGEILQGITGGNPIFAALNAGAGINITTGPGSITITNTGGGGAGGVIRTPFFASGSTQTWTKNASTKYVEVWGWCGGGGGGSGSSVTLNNQGGAGGGSGSFFRFKGPAEFFGATEDVKVGFGGLGGASVTTVTGNDGASGGVSYFGNIRVPLVVNNIVANGTLSSIMQAGAGGGSSFQTALACGYSGGVFADDASMIYSESNSNFQYGVPHPNTTGAAFGNNQKGGGAGSFAIGVDGLSTGGLSPYGLPSRGSFGFVYMLGTSGAQGGSIQSGTSHDGGDGGTIFGFDTTTVLSAGGSAGIASGVVAGGDGNNSIDPGSGLNGTGGLVFGGTGGGGGAADPNNGGRGGDGGFPGGGAGGGGAASVGRPSGAGGDGADGFVLVIEWT